MSHGVGASENAVRKGSLVSFFCNVATGSPTVSVAGKPMARVGDSIICAAGTTCPDGISQIFGTISNGSGSVRINGIPAAVSDVSVIADSCLGGALPIGGWPFVDVAP